MMIKRPKALKIYILSVILIILGYSLYCINVYKNDTDANNDLKMTESPFIEDCATVINNLEEDVVDSKNKDEESAESLITNDDSTNSLSSYIQSGDKPGYSLLHSAALTCNPEQIRNIASAYPDIVDEMTQDEQKKTVLVLIIENGRDVENVIECLDALKEANVNAICGVSGKKHTALYCAIKRNKPKLIEYLLKRGANASSTCYKRPILHHAIENCTEDTFPQVFRMLRDRKVDLTVTNNMNRAAIHEAAALNKDYAIRTMKPFCNIERVTPVLYSSKVYSDEELLQREKMCGATALHVAARFNSEAAYRQLIKLGASDNRRDFYDNLPEFYNPTMINFEVD